MSNSKSSESNKKQLLLIVTLGLLILIGLTPLYLNPEMLMTNSAKTLTGKEFVETENAIRGNVISIGGAIFILGTLWVNIIQTRISAETLNTTVEKLKMETKEREKQLALEREKVAQERENGEKQLALEREKVAQERENGKKQLALAREKFALEREKEWKNEVQDAYIEWAVAFLSGVKAGEDIVKYQDDADKKQEADSKHSLHHFIREKATLRIKFFEKRSKVLEIFEEINKYPYPYYPIIEHIKYKKDKEDYELLFYNEANKDKDSKETITGHFYGITKDRLTAFCAWISNPDQKSEIPSFNNYLELVKHKIPELAKVMDNIID